MKTRVKATGEIVEINESSTIYDARLCHVYNASELENVPDIDPDYWTRLEHQYAGMAMNALLLTNNIRNGDLEGMRECNTNAMAIACASFRNKRKRRKGNENRDRNR